MTSGATTVTTEEPVTVTLAAVAVMVVLPAATPVTRTLTLLLPAGMVTVAGTVAAARVAVVLTTTVPVVPVWVVEDAVMTVDPSLRPVTCGWVVGAVAPAAID